jgi:hypothetical protein
MADPKIVPLRVEWTLARARISSGTRAPGNVIKGKPRSIEARCVPCGTTFRARESRNVDPGSFSVAMMGNLSIRCPTAEHEEAFSMSDLPGYGNG